MTGGPDQPLRPFEPVQGIEYPSLEGSGSPNDPLAPVDYPEGPPPHWNPNAGLPPPVYPPPSPPPGYPGYGPPGYGYPGPAYPYSTPYPTPYSTDPYDPYRPAKPPGTNGKAIAALVTAAVGLLFCGLPSIAGLVLGIVAMRETRRTGQDGFGLALAGAIIGGLVVAFWLLYWVAVIGLVATGWQHAP